MIKCIKVVLAVDYDEALVHDTIQKQARKLGLEGVVYAATPGELKIVACGLKEKIDEFLDFMHKEAAKRKVEDIEVEPFIKDKDYRGVFRVIQ